MIRIRNREQLVKNGATPLIRMARSLALKSLELALNAVDPKILMYQKVKLKNHCLKVGDISFDLDSFKNVYVVGGGKAGSGMAEAIEEILGSRITAGTLNVPRGSRGDGFIELNETSHPIPDQAGVDATRRMIKIAEQATKADLVICLISGGGSSLMPFPREGVTLDDKKIITNALLNSGAAIDEINVVRKHLSAFKGGWLAKKAYPATVVNIILSDVVGDPLGSIASGPTVPDASTFIEAKKILEKYNLWTNVPSSVNKILTAGARGLLEETPKPGDPVFVKVHSVLIGSNRTACQGATEWLKNKGITTILFDEPLEGKARRMGKRLANFATKATESYFPIQKPLAAVVGGETTVVVKGKGLGGRNQELSLAAALNLSHTQNCVIASLATDGLDGPTKSAGAIVDGFTLKRSLHAGIDPDKSLAENDSHSFFEEIEDLIITGATGTNVNDISVIVIL